MRNNQAGVSVDFYFADFLGLDDSLVIRWFCVSVSD